MFHVVTGLIAFYVVWRLIWPLRWPQGVKSALSVALFLISQHHLVTRNFFGSMASPEVPSAVLMLLGWLFGSLILAASLLLARDIAGMVAYGLSRRTGRALLGSTVGLGIGAAAAVLSAIGVWQAVRVPDVRTVEIVMPNLPHAFDGFRVVQLTDLHASRLMQRPWMKAVVEKTNALNPDLTVITGDLADGTVNLRADDVLPLQELTASNGVFAITGNHEYYLDYINWVPRFKELGLRVLLNEHANITRDGQTLVIAGITDRTASSFGALEPDVQAALAGVSRDTPVILLSHRPADAAHHARSGVNLQLSGHTHGGQILGLHLAASWANNGYVSGRYAVEGMQLYVSNGTGLWPGFPIRLGRASEITEIILRSPATDESGSQIGRGSRL